MKKFAIGVLALAAVSGTAAAQTGIAYWSFTNQALPGGGFGFLDGAFPFGAEFGTQTGSATLDVQGGLTGNTIVTGGGDTVYEWIQSFAGSTVNAQFGEPAGGSISVQGGTDAANGGGNNGSYIEIAFDGGLWENLNFSFAGRRTGTGFNDVDIDLYDGGSLVGSLASDLNLTTNTTLDLYAFDASALDGISDARIRLTLNGATSTTGNVRLDNLYVQGNLIPTPGALALFGAAGLAATRRRRQG
ncbi:MAG: hypothetical protein ACTS3F_12690 [Phycisphaerales bacterium]